MRRTAICLLTLLPLSAQAPEGWNRRLPLGSAAPAQGWWQGAGIWAGDHTGPATTLVDSLGMGNALTGQGVHLEGGYRGGRWDLAAEILADRTPYGATFATLYRSHLWYRGDTGWQGGFEQEPLVWGYGLNGGYLLGEADRPFPRLRAESPMADLHLGRVPLGSWGWQAFMGRLENHRVLSGDLQDPSWRSRAVTSQGDVQAPLIMGYRAQATFGPLLEFYLNYLNLWSGTLNGQGMTQGYGFTDYLTAMTGTKDTLAEANTDWSDPSHPPVTAYKNKARSASEADLGFRAQVPSLARALGAQTSYAYVSRGTKSTTWPLGVFAKQPAYYLGKDVGTDLRHAGNPGFLWARNDHYTAPNLTVPNDTVGLLASWQGLRAGLEYFSGVNSYGKQHRTFAHPQYLSGFYYQGDPLGNALGGETIVTTAHVEVDFTPRLTGAISLMRGFHPFRDDLPDWQLDHPDQEPVKNRFTQLQQTVTWKAGRTATLGLGFAWQREQAVDNVAGQDGNGFAWFTDLAFLWPARP